MVTEYDGVSVSVIGLPDITKEEIGRYVEYLRKKIRAKLFEITISSADDGQVELGYVADGVKFERIRRITGKPKRIALKVA